MIIYFHLVMRLRVFGPYLPPSPCLHSVVARHKDKFTFTSILINFQVINNEPMKNKTYSYYRQRIFTCLLVLTGKVKFPSVLN
jgi:hypothetical protein